MLTLGVVAIALAVLFSLTTMAFWAAERPRHPLAIVVGLAALFVVGLALLLE